MGSHQQFCLRWNNHQSNLLNVFEKLLEQETLVDVTLACEGLSLKAHKVVLSACSPYFQNLFANNPCKHPIVILKDVKYADLKSVVNFMYRGEINVIHEQLDALLKVADTLQVKGLAEVTENFCSNKDGSSSELESISVNRFSRKKHSARANNHGASASPPSKRRKKPKGTAGGGVGSSVGSVLSLPTSVGGPADNSQEKEKSVDFPVISSIKTENVSELSEFYHSRSCSDDSTGDQNNLQNRARQSRLDEISANVRQICENAIVSDEESCLNIPYTDDHVEIEMAAATASSSDATSLPPDLINEEINDSIYYPSTSLNNVDTSLSGDPSSHGINSSCLATKGAVHANVISKPVKNIPRATYRGGEVKETYLRRMQSACLAVAEGLSFRQAALRYSLNAPTVWRYYVRAGRPQLLGYPDLEVRQIKSERNGV